MALPLRKSLASLINTLSQCEKRSCHKKFSSDFIPGSISSPLTCPENPNLPRFKLANAIAATSRLLVTAYSGNCGSLGLFESQSPLLIIAPVL